VIYVTLNQQSFRRYMSALIRLANSYPIESDKLCRYGAIDYKNLVTQAIASNNFPRRVPRHTKAYAQWKNDKGKPSRIGILDFDLLHNITVFQDQGGWFGGVQPGVMDSGGKNWNLKGRAVEIVKYGMWLEEGNRVGQPDNQRPRPIFMPIARKYIKEGFPNRMNVTIRRLEAAWH
jgi:hypothetical protein